MLCCLLAALAASPLLWWPKSRRAACCGPGAAPVVLFGLAFAAGMAVLCLALLTTPGAAAFHHICSVAGLTGRSD